MIPHIKKQSDLDQVVAGIINKQLEEHIQQYFRECYNPNNKAQSEELETLVESWALVKAFGVHC